MRFRVVLLAALSPSITACAPVSHPSETAASALAPDPQRRVQLEVPRAGARLVPIEIPEGKTLGAEPGGGTRAILGGVRVVSSLGGAVEAAADALPGTKWDVLALPERLGGGFLFKVEEKSIWRADKWLGAARPLYAAGTNITRIVPGLDRVYVLAGAWRAFDGTSGEEKPLGPWPTSPTVSAYAAADGWRALAIADLRGTLATTDAGATWHRLVLPIEPRDLLARGDSLEVRGIEPGHGDAYYEIRADGQVVRLADGGPKAQSAATEASAPPPGPLGAHALVAAVEDGWPLDDGTALVARDGALSRVRLEDGAVVETVPGAFELRPSRCHPILFGGPGSLGFVCGEPRGATVLYAFDAARGRMSEARRFGDPRAVLSSGNGGVAVRGRCDAQARGDGSTEAHYYCIRSGVEAWREIRIEGAIGGERVAVLADGRFVVVSPPQRGGAANLTMVDGARMQTVALQFPPVGSDVARVLNVGVWLDGLEERHPGVVGGWVEAAGTMLGFELSLDGKVRLGDLVRGESTLPMVSGRYGFGWSMAHHGFETTDGGMKWSPVAVPDPVKPLREVASRACGPVGCSAAGWLRIGWGKVPVAPAAPPHAPRPPTARSTAALALDCDLGSSVAKDRAADDPLGAPPAATKDARVVTYEAQDTLDHAHHPGTLARVYAWGPRGSDWDQGARWVVRWDWPFGGAADVRASAPAPLPSTVLDATRSSTMINILPSLLLTVALGDDPSHALLVARRGPRAEPAVFELEADHAPLEIRRPDGDAIGEIEGAVRASGRWYIATAPPPARLGERMEETVWQVDGAIARELARIPRVAPDGRIGPGRLAARGDGRALGLVVDGQPLADRSGPTRWIAPIDLDSGTVSDSILLGGFYLGDDHAISLCNGDDAGWSLDVPLEGGSTFPILVASRGVPIGGLHSAFARVHLAHAPGGAACIERLAGSLAPTVDAPGSHPPTPALSTSITVAATTENDQKARRVFRCGVR